MAKKSGLRKKIKEFAADGRIKKGESRKLAKFSGGDIKTKKLIRKINKYSAANSDLKINKKSDELIKQYNVKSPTKPKGPGDETSLDDETSTGNEGNEGNEGNDTLPTEPKDRFQGIRTEISDFTTSIRNELDGMFAGQAERDAELERQEAERLKKFELNQRTLLGNEGRAGQQANYRLGGAAGRMKGGTSGFKRRKLKKAGRIMSGINTGTAGTLNV